ncbi:hypothetical protein Goshw_021097 [Gossypium schwendimanii]|uniref:Uncharacterized protein n=8 Tax=Gossypium TaxID=3633 RepID=A0A7J9LIC6_GOSSC|nr:hypothetical protein ES319_D09G192700v1 [Gossypium barbadense]MBA0615996.1 hypothetical protein [Gossypium davidsonii]MBA0651249.1 hypothetical protein [Gossypium klotzschianum]MBA0858069.1 hypothetical protein [Gossypium schwendimanii]TYG54690.1 hypothetical protein ES288_D09G210300v1 [Gossypium darwinii]TYH54971.1 hypothetical protein ES332_D09G206200v1 [Gossypium tomentosum]TYI66067.1 hypothetical protein E1A91_D09G198700v1 [Gossypium mustelinum]
MGRFEERGFDSVVCPKPIRTFRWSTNSCYQTEMADSKTGAELLDIILPEGGYGAENPTDQMASSPPYFCGSPPSRASNPVIQDARFNDEQPVLPPLTSPAPSSRGGCVRVKFGQMPAAVRIEGFDCLTRDGRHRSISAVA